MEDLFGNTENIFGNVPEDTRKSAKAKTDKAKKKKKVPSAKAASTEVTTTTTESTSDSNDGVTPANSLNQPQKQQLQPKTMTLRVPVKFIVSYSFFIIMQGHFMNIFDLC